MKYGRNVTLTNNNDNWHVHLSNFEGPLELLLKLIKSSKMDIYDIQISQITNQYNNYLEHMKKLNIDIAGEYFVMSAKLMNIKAKMLLPSYDDDFNEVEEDPREDLVQQLLEYKHYKNLANHLLTLKEKQSNFYTADINQYNQNSIIKNSDVDLLKTIYINLMKNKRFRDTGNVHSIQKWHYSIEQQSNLIMDKLSNNHKTNFMDIFDFKYDLEEVITDFLAVLQMSKNKLIKLSQLNNELFLEKLN